ncbi:MAG: DUF6290 family protein [Rhizobiaceae bacterium]
MLTIDLTPAEMKRLEALAKRLECSKEELAFDAVAERIEDLEDALLVRERLESDDGVRIPLEDVMKEIAALEAEERDQKPAAE